MTKKDPSIEKMVSLWLVSGTRDLLHELEGRGMWCAVIPHEDRGTRVLMKKKDFKVMKEWIDDEYDEYDELGDGCIAPT